MTGDMPPGGIAPAEKARLFRIACNVLANGENVVERLTRVEGAPARLAIEIAYALQSGTYTDYARTATAQATRREGHAILEPWLEATGCRTLLDCGAGEGTRWLDFAAPIDAMTLLDASWRRLSYARENMAKVPSVADVRLVKSDMLTLPFAPHGFDAVFTSHAIEPNTDADAALILGRLFATARRLVVLFEPNYRDAPPRMRARMERHGYARNIAEIAEAQEGFDRVAAGDFETSPNPDNRTSYFVFRRRDPVEETDCRLVAPGTDVPLLARPGGGLIDADGCFVYPMIDGIQCLAEEDGIFVGAPPDGDGDGDGAPAGSHRV